MSFVVRQVMNKKTIKAIVKHRIRKGHTSLSKRIWESIYTELQIVPDKGQFFQLLSNCDGELVYIVNLPGWKGPLTADMIVNLPVEEIAKFPGGLQEIIFEARKTKDYNRTVTFFNAEATKEGRVNLEILGKKKFKRKDY